MSCFLSGISNIILQASFKDDSVKIRETSDIMWAQAEDELCYDKNRFCQIPDLEEGIIES